MSTWLLGLSAIVYVGMLLVDRYRPARQMPQVQGPWRWWGLFFFGLTIVINGAVPYVLRPVVATHHLLDGRLLGDVGGAVVGYALYDLIVYWLHRTYHRVPVLWRWVHQMHHAPERMDPAGMCFFHPLEIVGLAVVSAGFYGFVLGLSTEASALAGVIFVGFGIFQHSNLRTPAWLGYFIQRPEQHGLHHQRGVHAFNYSDLPLWDLVFGTFQNPKTWDAQAGFYDGALAKWPQLLRGEDVVRARVSR